MNWQFSVQLVSPKIAPFTSIKSQSTFLSIHSELALAFISSTVPNHFGLFDVDRVTPFSQQDQDKKKRISKFSQFSYVKYFSNQWPFARLTKIIIHAHIVEGWNIWHAVNFKDNIPVREWKKKRKISQNSEYILQVFDVDFLSIFYPILFRRNNSIYFKNHSGS